MSPTSTKPPGCSRRTLVIINLFVVPVAIAGLVRFPDGTADGDMFVLALPMAGRQELLTLLTFIGGLSAATGMVIVASGRRQQHGEQRSHHADPSARAAPRLVGPDHGELHPADPAARHHCLHAARLPVLPHDR
jgi:hypothetical protein